MLTLFIKSFPPCWVCSECYGIEGDTGDYYIEGVSEDYYFNATDNYTPLVAVGGDSLSNPEHPTTSTVIQFSTNLGTPTEGMALDDIHFHVVTVQPRSSQQAYAPVSGHDENFSLYQLSLVSPNHFSVLPGKETAK
jgi:hypothetical protein